MGNNNSGHINVQQPHPPWTQSLPRDAHSLKKYAVIQDGLKVLPERIPGQRLRPTENGKNLQIQGTISPRKLNGVNNNNNDDSKLSNNSSSSLTALTHPKDYSCHPKAYSYYPKSSSGSAHELNFASPPSKSFTSEPDLRENSPTSHGSLPGSPRNLISDSPSRVKLKSKKRNKAPLPPFQQSLFIERPHLVPSTSSPDQNVTPSKSFKSKQKKIGLFKKRGESRMLNYDTELSNATCNEERLQPAIERSRTPIPLNISSKKDLRTRARSLDNLYYDLQKSSKDYSSSRPLCRTPDREIDNFNSDSSNGRRCNTLEKESKCKERPDKRTCNTIEREGKSHRRMSNVERRLYEKQLQERDFEERYYSSDRDDRVSPTRGYRKTTSNSSHHPKDDWDIAEEEWYHRKKKSDELQLEILNAAKNLRKTFSSNDEDAEINSVSNSEDEVDGGKDDIPKSFFFGMEPESVDHTKDSNKTNTALAKLNEQNKIINSKQLRNKVTADPFVDRENEIFKNIDNTEDKRRLSRKIDEFVATIERTKSQRVHSPEELSNSISRKGDGGYHSRQNSGSFHLETEGSDEDNMIKMNLRPTLPRKQLELPRFSPNAAWRSLSVESPVRKKELCNEYLATQDVFNISEDKIYRYTRPTAPLRGSGEKSADSGISGDAGSPGPIQEFDSINIEKLKSSVGPLAISSPVVNARLNGKHTWTPSQDLDENSFEETVEQNGKSSSHLKIAAIPKLTSRSNMFSNIQGEEHFFRENSLNGNSHRQESNIEKFGTNKNERMKRSPSPSKDYEGPPDKAIPESSWRENWSLSRSIPNSLNNCDEPDVISNSSRQCRSRSESRMSVKNIQAEGQISDSRPITPSSFNIRNNNRHIMYLPEYKSYQMQAEVNNKHSKLNGECASSGIPYENERWEKPPRKSCPDKKSKKFSYQSTVRMLEKKKLEAKLSKDAEEKERQRLREIEAMMKVEQEFQKKREREKKRLKKELKNYQKQHKGKNPLPEDYSSSSEDKTFQSSKCSEIEPCDSLGRFPDHIPPPHLRPSSPPSHMRPSSPPPIIYGNKPNMGPYQANGVPYHSNTGPYQSLPVELNSMYHSDHLKNNQNGLFSDLKKLLKGRKEHRSGYHSEVSSVTLASDRQDPEGALPYRKNVDIRSDIIAGARHRNGTHPIVDYRYANGSPATSIASKDSRQRLFTPDSKRTVSSDSRRSISSEPLTRELPEMRQEHRMYREYRSPKKTPLNMLKHHLKVSSISHNYRRDFCLGNSQINACQNDTDRYSRVFHYPASKAVLVDMLKV